jgi:hypothetical protein
MLLSTVVMMRLTDAPVALLPEVLDWYDAAMAELDRTLRARAISCTTRDRRSCPNS